MWPVLAGFGVAAFGLVVGDERWWSRGLAAAVAVGAVATGGWLYLLILDEI